LASAGVEDVVRVWEVEQGVEHRALKGHRWVIGGLLWAHGGATLLSSSANRTINLWGVEEGVCLHTFETGNALINAISLRPDEELLASAGEDGALKVWQLASRELVWVQKAPSRSWEPPVADVAWSPSGHLLASVHRDDTVHLWDAGGALRATLHHKCRHVAWRPQGDKLLLHGTPPLGVRVWDVSRV
jgi:WD40 repeat protein